MAAKLSGPAGAAEYTVEQNHDINVTPFVDVMLVLLIIFMVAAPLASVSVKLTLPPAVVKAPTNPPRSRSTFRSSGRAGCSSWTSRRPSRISAKT